MQNGETGSEMGEMRLELTIDNLPMLGGNLEEQLRRGNIERRELVGNQKRN